MQCDIAIVGTGPAGVSAAWPLIGSGQDILLIDASVKAAKMPPDGEYFALRRQDTDQRNWMFGADVRSWLSGMETSPKLRVPTLRGVFEGFADANRIETENFLAVGSLASGGLSNAWGCGVARFSSEDLADFPFMASDLDSSFAAVSRRIGLSGRSDDALKDYFGLDDWAAAAPPLDDNAAHLLGRYQSQPPEGVFQRLRVGRARVAVLSSDMQDRKGCNLSGLCLWGCARGALYSAAQELGALKRNGARLRQGFVVDHVRRTPAGLRLHGIDRNTGAVATIDAKRVVLAAGTLATTAIAWRSLGRFDSPGRLLSNPTAAFLLLRLSGARRAPVPGPAFGQLSFTHRSETGVLAHGAMFSPAHLPAFEFIKHIPTSRLAARLVWRLLCTSTLVGNAFLPAAFTKHSAILTPAGKLRITGHYGDGLPAAVADLERGWRQAAWRLGYAVMPGSFRLGQVGADIHYAGTLPMRHDSIVGETDAEGKLTGLPGIYVADAATFPSLPAKPHTLTMMAMADRLGRRLAGLGRSKA